MMLTNTTSTATRIITSGSLSATHPKTRSSGGSLSATAADGCLRSAALAKRTSSPLDPFREAVGGVIQDVVVIELWLRSLSSQLLELRTHDRDASDRRVKDNPPQQQISINREQVSQVLTTEHAEAVLAALPEVESVLTARNHLVHGIWLPNADRRCTQLRKRAAAATRSASSDSRDAIC